MKRTDWLVAAVLVGCALALIACGGSGSGSGHEPSAEKREEAGLEFAACMREHGVDVPDPKAGGGVIVGGPGGKTELGGPEMTAAMKACEGKLEAIEPDLSPEEEEEMKERALAFAECMREHGVDMPDPQFGQGGKVRLSMGGPGSADSPAFGKAQEACQDKGGPVLEVK
jgi:hypothetical protein